MAGVLGWSFAGVLPILLVGLCGRACLGLHEIEYTLLIPSSDSSGRSRSFLGVANGVRVTAGGPRTIPIMFDDEPVDCCDDVEPDLGRAAGKGFFGETAFTEVVLAFRLSPFVCAGFEAVGVDALNADMRFAGLLMAGLLFSAPSFDVTDSMSDTLPGPVRLLATDGARMGGLLAMLPLGNR